MTAFQFKFPHKIIIKIAPRVIRAERVTTEAIGPIQGIAPGSKEEWRLAMALSQAGIQYRYQVPIYGGNLRGGQIVDFVAYIPYPQPVQVFGEHWHPGELDDQERFNLARIEQIYGRPAKIFWASDLTSVKVALVGVREQLA